MNEQAARNVVLVRAIETADPNGEILSQDDRRYASRCARELAQWQAADSGAEPTMEHFLQHRSEQIVKKVAERIPPFALFAKARNKLGLLLALLPVAAFLFGIGADRITDPHRVDLLSAPLLLIIGWNLLVYAAMLVFECTPSRKTRYSLQAWPFVLAKGQTPLPRKLPSPLANALAAFTAEWMRLGRKLAAARVSRSIHSSAALFALGAMLSLYARGLLTQYAAGWESTFLDAKQVHALLAVLFAPAVTVFHLQGFSLADIEALRFTTAPSSGGGARWVHLYAATLFLLVVLPRLSLAAFAHWRAKQLEQNFPLDLEHPYFWQLGHAAGNAAGILRVLPYSFTLDEARDKGLNEIAAMLLGEQVRVMLRPSIAYGDEPEDALRGMALDDPKVALTAVLFNLAATPEQENHGALLDYLALHSQRGLAVLVDESGYLQRIGGQAGSAARIAERIALWQQFCAFHKAPATIVNLLDPTRHPVDLSLSSAPAR